MKVPPGAPCTGCGMMDRPILREPPSGAPEGTVWFGGPVDRFRVTLRICSEELDPDHISVLLGCAPTRAERKGTPISVGERTRIPGSGRWSLSVHSEECGEGDDVEDGVRILLERLPSDGSLWASLTTAYSVDVFCGLFLASENRGFGMSAELCKLLADRNLEIGFDLCFDPPGRR